MKAGLTHDTFLEAMDVVKEKQNYSEDYITDELREMVIEERNENPTLYKSLAYSISPEIFKMKKIKRALLLQMIGGVTKQMEDGMKIRGNINVLLMGDPGVAKSQLLKHISSFAPRGIYTTGKGSSGVGLTAAVMKDPVTGKISTANTRHVLKGGEDSVGEHLALIRVYVNIGMCTEECWTPNFPYPGRLIGRGTKQSPMRIMQCAAQCDPWNYADAKMDDLTAFLITGGPTYVMAAKDSTGTGSQFVDTKVVPKGRQVFARECAACHSTVMAPENIRNDKNALGKFYEGHIFGKEDYWTFEYSEAERNDPKFIARFMAKDAKGQLRPKQFAEKGIFGQDWLGNDERVPFNIVGTNMCRALHNNHNQGHIWEEFSSETYKNSPSPGSIPNVLNRMIPFIGGTKLGERKVEGGPGYLRNISLLSVWATAPFLHNNAVGEVTYLPDGSPDYTVAGRIKQFEMAYDELMTSDNPKDSVHRPQKTLKTTEDMHVTPREDMQGYPKIPVKKGTPVANFASQNPHNALFMGCDDPVENKGHQFGVSLSKEDKYALREFLKMM